MTKNLKKYLIGFLFFILIARHTGPAYTGDISIIINNENAVDEVSFKDLARIFKREKQYWEDGRKIYLVMQESKCPEKAIILEKVYKMNNENLKKFWIAKMFKGDISSFPKTFSSSGGVRRFVSQAPNAIGFIDSDYLDGSVKTLKINGKSPNDKGYILAGGINNEN